MIVAMTRGLYASLRGGRRTEDTEDITETVPAGRYDAMLWRYCVAAVLLYLALVLAVAVALMVQPSWLFIGAAILFAGLVLLLGPLVIGVMLMLVRFRI